MNFNDNSSANKTYSKKRNSNQTLYLYLSVYFFLLLLGTRIFSRSISPERKVSNKNVNSSVCNDVEQMTAVTSQATASSVQIMRISDASGSYEDVVLRPKPTDHNCRLVRSLAAISGLFKSNRVSGANHEQNADNSPKVSSSSSGAAKKMKKKTWNLFKLKKKARDASPSFHHFQEPLNVERLSLAMGGVDTYNDNEWYDLNRDEMSLFEARVSDILNDFNNYNQISGESGSELDAIHRSDNGRHLTVSSNILWSHNLSVSCQSNNDNASNVNLLGANINREQIHSDVYIEHDEALAQTGECSAPAELNVSFVSTDSDGYAVMQPIHAKKYVEPTILIDDDITKSLNLHRDYNSDDSCHLSSGFGSDSDCNSPQKFLAFVNSPATSDFSDAFPSGQSNECSPTTPLLTKTMQKTTTTKKRRLQIKSRKLFGMLYAKQTPSPVNVTPTPPNKSPTHSQEKKPAFKGTPPFKVRSSKPMHEQRDIEPKPTTSFFTNIIHQANQTVPKSVNCIEQLRHGQRHCV